MKLNLSQSRVLHNHRYGWRYCLDYLSAYHCGAGIFVDDCIERSFSQHLESYYSNNKYKIPYNQPWIGFIHNPHNMPVWYEYCHSPQSIFSRAVFQDSLAKCKCLITLSEYLAEWVRSQTDVPVISIKYPTGIAERWSPHKFLKSKKKLIQVGHWLRDINSIAKIKALDYKKIWLSPSKNNLNNNIELEMLWQDVKILDFIDNTEYDRLLSESVIFLDLLDCSASNTIIEAIIRNTPIIVNRHPAIEEYLGVNYPLFYDKYVENLNTDKVIEAHNYLKNMNKDWIDGEYFINNLINQLRDIL